MINVAARAVGMAVGSVAAVLLAACASSADSSSNAQAPQGQPGGVVTTKDITGVGTVLVDQAGDTLYFTDSDQGGIRCTGDCLEIWVPATGATDAKISGLGTVKRMDNSLQQVTYQGKPLYVFTMDDPQRPVAGDNAKDSFGGTDFTWHAAIVQGTPSSGDGYGSGGGGY